MRLETPAKLRFDSYSLDVGDKVQASQKLVSGGVPVNEGLVVSVLLEGTV